MQETQEKIDVLHCTVHQGQIYTAGLGQAGLGPLALSWERLELEGLGSVDHTLISPLSQLGSLQLCWRWSVLNPHFCWSGFWWGQAILFFTTILSSIKTWEKKLKTPPTKITSHFRKYTWKVQFWTWDPTLKIDMGWMQVVFVVVFSAGDVGQVVVFWERARLLNQQYQHHYVHEQKIFIFFQMSSKILFLTLCQGWLFHHVFLQS